jgi:UDP-N-acetylglucosamine 2-epimerase (non-hydrolysing)
MRDAMTGLRDVAERETDLLFLVPMHRNPIVRGVIEDVLGETDNAILTEPLTYHEFCHAMQHALLLVTDSGGVQEEGPSLGKPVLVLRDTTERPEAVDAGTVKLIGTDRGVVEWEVIRLLRDRLAYESMANAVNPYGDGLAAQRANAAIRQLFGIGERLPDFAPATLRRGVNV